MPKVSVVIQSHNRPMGLQRALQSLQMQTFQDFEVLISDDSARPAEIAAVLAGPAAQGLRIDHRHTPPCGAAESMREAFGRASGDCIKILHDDDWLTPHSLAAAVRALDANPDVGVVYGRAIISYPGQDKVFYDFFEEPSKIASADWVRQFEANGLGPLQSPVTALYRRHDGFRIMWDEFQNPVLREAARKTGAGTDVSLQVDNALSAACVLFLPVVVCFLGTDMSSTTQTDPRILEYYRLWKLEYDTNPPWRRSGRPA
jgi:glycosyltransferase involved in cell wall biosynthesis